MVKVPHVVGKSSELRRELIEGLGCVGGGL